MLLIMIQSTVFVVSKNNLIEGVGKKSESISFGAFNGAHGCIERIFLFSLNF